MTDAASPYAFHIPVMGTGFSLETPLRVARFGISSVMSIVDDVLIERVRRHHARAAGLDDTPIRAEEPDSRARRITAWLDLVDEIIERQMTELRALPFVPGNDKTKYFELLADTSPKKHAYLAMLALPAGPERERAEHAVTELIVRGSADVNIMTKVDRARMSKDGELPAADQSDAKAALRGFAASRLEGDLILSAGINPTLFGLLERYPAFYRDTKGRIAKGIILKVSDFRSSLVQGKFLAKKGIELKELRIESGLNCGGHLFATDGELLGPIVEEVAARREELREGFEAAVREHYEKHGRPFVGGPRRIRVTAQGGVGTVGEARRLMDGLGADSVGWGTPFLVVREVTTLDDATRAKLVRATVGDVYVSDASPLGIPFSNLRGSSSDTMTRQRIDAGRPGSPCPRGFLAANTEFTKEPICTASREYQSKKLEALGYTKPPSYEEANEEVRAIYAKQCICNDLGNGALIQLGIVRSQAPVAVCPSQNIAWFDREVTLREMVDHIHGRGASLVPKARPHFLAKELSMYVDHFENELRATKPDDTRGLERLASFKKNLDRGLERYRALVRETAFEEENLASLAQAIEDESARLDRAWSPRASAAE